jgi:hypothetical protein
MIKTETIELSQTFSDVGVRVKMVNGKFEHVYLGGGAPSFNFLNLRKKPKESAAILRRIAEFLEKIDD